MNKKTILGISIAAVFAIGMVASPALAAQGNLLDGLLKDHAQGKNPAKNPAHYELIVNAEGNYTQYAVDETGVGAAAVGFGIVNNTDYVFAFTSHSFDDCDNPEDCSDFLPHGHGAQLGAPSADCDGFDLEIVDGSIVDLGEATLTVAGDESSTRIVLDDIPADAQLGLVMADICDDTDSEDVATLVEFTIVAGDNDALCVDVVNDTLLIDSADGPANKNKNGGFSDSLDQTEAICPDIPS